MDHTDNPVLDDKPAASPNSERFVVFFLNDRLYAVPSSAIAEVIHPLPITPLPGAEGWLSGIANFRGELLAILNLKNLWKAENAAFSEKAKLIVLRSESAHTAFAFKVDKLSEIVVVPNTDIHAIREESDPHIYGKVDRGGNSLQLVDIASLLASLTFK